MYLSDVEIQEAITSGELEIEPLDDAMLEATTVNLRLLDTLHVPRETPPGTALVIADFRQARPQEFFRSETITATAPYRLSRHGFVLAKTYERIAIRPDARLMGFIEGRSGVARHGIIVHCTAPLIAPGWNGQITLEIVNLGPYEVPLRLEDSICQIAFARLGRASSRPYPGFSRPQPGFVPR